jgi:hypothetical protein
LVFRLFVFTVARCAQAKETCRSQWAHGVPSHVIKLSFRHFFAKPPYYSIATKRLFLRWCCAGAGVRERPQNINIVVNVGGRRRAKGARPAPAGRPAKILPTWWKARLARTPQCRLSGPIVTPVFLWPAASPSRTAGPSKQGFYGRKPFYDREPFFDRGSF